MDHVMFFGACFALVLGLRGFIRQAGNAKRLSSILYLCMSWSLLHTLSDGESTALGFAFRIPILTNLVVAAIVLHLLVASMAFPGHQRLQSRRRFFWLVLPALLLDLSLVISPHGVDSVKLGVDVAHALGALFLVYSAVSGLWVMLRQRVPLLRNPRALYVMVLSLTVFILILMGLAGLAFSQDILLNLVSVGFTVLLVVQFLVTERHTELLEDYRKDVVREAYRNSSLKGFDTESLTVSLITLMEEKRPYLEEDCSLQRLAGALGISGHQLSELLNRVMDISFPRFIHNYRIKMAKELLNGEPGKTVLDIAYEVGYGNKTSFNEAFRNLTGMTPRQYRKNSLESQE